MGVLIGERLLRCLLYADDVVILAKSPEELQQFIDIVDQFCSDWHMNVNLKKSNVMVVGHPDCKCGEHASPICPDGCGCSARTVDQPRKTSDHDANVQVSWNLSTKFLWNDHLKYMLPKTVGNSNLIRGLMANNRITPRDHFGTTAARCGMQTQSLRPQWNRCRPRLAL